MKKNQYTTPEVDIIDYSLSQIMAGSSVQEGSNNKQDDLIESADDLGAKQNGTLWEE